MNYPRVDTLILGCTHYPLIEKYIKRYFSSLKLIIGEGVPSEKTFIKFFVSGDSKKFTEVVQEFLKTSISDVEKIIL